VRILTADDTPLATLPIVDVTLSVPALLRGNVVLKTLNLEAARVRLVRADDGTFRLGMMPEEPGSSRSPAPLDSLDTAGSDNHSQVIADIVKTLVAEADPARPLTSLEEVRIVRGSVVVHDQRLGTTWRATQVAVSLRRSTAGLSGTARLNLALQDTLARVEAALTYHRASAKLSLDGTFAQLQPSTLAAVVPNLDALMGVDLPVSGTLRVTLDLQGRVETLHFKLSGEAGRLSFPEILPEPLLIGSFIAQGRLDGESRTAYLEEAIITFGSSATPGPRLRIQGSVGRDITQVTMQGQVALSTLPLKDLARYWPQGLASHARTWLLEHGSAGVVDEVQGSVVLAFPSENSSGGYVTSFDGKLHAHLPQPHTPARVIASAAYNGSQQTATLDVAFTNLRPAVVAEQTPTLSGLAGVEVPLDGKLAAHLGTDGQVHDLRVAITGKPGTISHPTLFPEPRQVSSLTAQGHLNGAEHTFTLQEATVVLGTSTAPGPRLKASGSLQGGGKSRTLNTQVTLQALPMLQLTTYWPVGVSAKARTWLTENLVAGTVEEATANLVFQLPGGSLSPASLDQLNGTIRYRDLEVHYLRPLPPATGVSGTASFNQQGFRIQINSGQVSDAQFTTGTVDITGLDQRRDAIAIRVGMHRHPLRTPLTLLAHPRLNLLSNLGINPTSIDGQAMVELGFSFPLRGVIDLPKVDFTARGTFEQVSMPQILLGHSVEKGQLTLALDKAGMTLKGTADFATIPVRLEWQEAFTKQAPWKSQIHAVVPQVEASRLAQLGVNLTEYVSGPLMATVSARLGWQRAGQIETNVRLEQAVLSLPFLGWHKAAGAAGEAQGVLHLNPTASHHGTFTLAAGTLTMRGDFHLDSNADVPLRLQLRDLIIGHTRLQQVAIEHHGQTLDVTLGEGDVDVQPLLRRQTAQATEPSQADSRGVKESSPPVPKDGLRVHVQAPGLRRVYFADGRYLQEVQVSLIRTPAGWELIDFTGQVPKALVQLSRPEQADSQEGQSPPLRTVRVEYRPANQPANQPIYTLTVLANDLGSVLRAVNLHDGVIGGRLQIDGHTLQPDPGSPILGRLEVKEFSLQDAPVLARILAAASLPGLLKMLNNDGLAFTSLSGDFTLSDGMVTTKQLRSHGGALGLTAKGTVDVKASTLNLRGTVIPFYGLNTLLSHIPLLGNILMGGKGEGLIAVSYRLTGPFADPQVTVNPASVLTPGALRGIFELFESSSDVDIDQQFPPPSSEESSP
jgi:hypothetical protein